MSEAALLALDLLVMVYCCWIVIRVSKKSKVESKDLGFLAYREGQGKPKR
ncbi:hypothetical protein M2244_003411 [Rhodoferax antarcticus]|nr:hypothetical protein [Rhodoferax antarcticus]